MNRCEERIGETNAARFILDERDHRVLDADSAFYNLTGFRPGGRFEEIFDKAERAGVQNRLDEKRGEGEVAGFTAGLRPRPDGTQWVCVALERRKTLSGAAQLHGVLTIVEKRAPAPAGQREKTGAFSVQELKAGIERNEFSLNIQPFFNLSTGKIAGGEILTRWRRQGEELMPHEFFAQLSDEEIGCELDYHVFTTAMPILSAMIKRGFHVPVSFNISEQHFKRDGFAERVEALAEAFDVEKRLIMFKIKAGLLESQDTELYQQLADLRQAGFRVVVDEIKGDSRSLLAIESGVVNMVKMERTFISRCVDTDFGRELLGLLLETMHKFEIQLICTGVETDRQKEFLKKCGCNYAQGFLFARPISLEEFSGTI